MTHRRARGRRTAVGVALAGLCVVLLAGPAVAENPVLDPATDAEVADALARATEVQGVCYGYLLQVDDFDTGQWDGTYGVTGDDAESATERTLECPQGSVQLVAEITYTSSFSDAEDSASWQLLSTVDADLDIGDVEALGFSSDDLLDDGKSETTLMNAVLSLPTLVAERSDVPPVTLQPSTADVPADAEPTGDLGSDWLRENGTLLLVSALAVAGGLVLLVLSTTSRRA